MADIFRAILDSGRPGRTPSIEKPKNVKKIFLARSRGVNSFSTTERNDNSSTDILSIDSLSLTTAP